MTKVYTDGLLAVKSNSRLVKSKSEPRITRMTQMSVTLRAVSPKIRFIRVIRGSLFGAWDIKGAALG